MALKHTEVLRQPAERMPVATHMSVALRMWLALSKLPAQQRKSPMERCTLLVKHMWVQQHMLLVRHMWLLVLHKSLEHRTVGLQTA